MEMLNRLRQSELLWDIYTRSEEYESEFRDSYGRFPACMSNNANIFKPLVSEFLFDSGLKAVYPGNKTFAVNLTHDIDIVNYSGLKIPYEAAMALSRGKIGRTGRVLLNKFSRTLNPIWNFDRILKLERQFEARSSFYFLALEKGETDFNFRPDQVKDVFKDLIDAGCEVGLHGGHQAYNNPDVLKREKERLEKAVGKEITGYRSHYLRFEVPTTWEILSDAGFQYDTTFGFADCVGFRNGMCHPYKPFNRTTEKLIDILEIPLIIMDCTFDFYMRFDLEQAWKLTCRLIDRVAELHGVMTILWHNTYFLDEQYDFYKKILSYCSEKNAWMTSGDEIHRWWTEHNFIEY